jgi:hypothetical protein
LKEEVQEDARLSELEEIKIFDGHSCLTNQLPEKTGAEFFVLGNREGVFVS